MNKAINTTVINIGSQVSEISKAQGIASDQIAAQQAQYQHQQGLIDGL